MTDPEALADKLEDVVAITTLGLGVLAAILGVGQFWVIFVIGWLLFVPLIDTVGADVIGWLLDRSDEPIDEESDALATLQNRYASGEIDDAEFERQLERLLENETVEDVEQRVERETAEKSVE